MVEVYSNGTGAFDDGHIGLLSTLASAAAAALENARQYEGEQQQARLEAERLRELTERLGGSISSDEVLDQIAATAAELLRSPVAGVFLLDSSGEYFDLAAGRGIQLESEVRLPRTRSLARRVVVEGHPSVVPDVRAMPGTALPRLVSGEDVGSLVVAPIISRSRPLGVVEVYSTASGAFDVRHGKLLASLAGAAAAALENSRTYAAEQRARREAERLYELAEQLSQSLAADEVLTRIASTAAELLEAPVAGVFLLDNAQDTLVLEAGFGFDLTATPDVRLPRAQSAADAVLRTGEPAIIPDVRLASVTALPRLVAGAAVGSLVVVPVVSRSRPLGVIEVYSPTAHAFAERDAGLLKALAATAATALENARAYMAEQRTRREAERLQALTAQLGHSLDVDELLERIAVTATELLDCTVGGVFLMDRSKQAFELVSGVGVNLGARLPVSRSVATQVVASRQPALVNDLRQHPGAALPELVTREPVGSLVVVPIILPSGPLGVIEVYSTATGAFQQRHADLLMALAGTAAIVLHNAELYRQREADLARLQAIVEQLPVGLLVADAESGMIVVRNRHAELLFGDALTRLGPRLADAGEDVSDAQRDAAGEWPLARALEKGETVEGELVEIERPDGGRAFVSINATPIRDAQGEIVAAVAVFDEVTGEEELRRQKNQFLAAAAHDLKTPLTSIHGLVQVLDRQLARTEIMDAERVRPLMSGIEAGTRKMNALIDELLDISRLDTIGAVSLNRREADLVQIARAVADAHRGNLDQHAIRVASQAGSLIGFWDEARLERALSNLVDNAIKYSPQGGEVVITITSEDNEGDGLAAVAVTDQGIGIPATEMERIFKRFQRGSNVPEKLPGSGIGLAYAREIVVQHGGSIEVRSQPGQGSTFTIRLPRRAV